MRLQILRKDFNLVILKKSRGGVLRYPFEYKINEMQIKIIKSLNSKLKQEQKT